MKMARRPPHQISNSTDCERRRRLLSEEKSVPIGSIHSRRQVRNNTINQQGSN